MFSSFSSLVEFLYTLPKIRLVCGTEQITFSPVLVKLLLVNNEDLPCSIFPCYVMHASFNKQTEPANTKAQSTKHILSLNWLPTRLIALALH